MAYKVFLVYFRPTGKFLAQAETMLAHEAITTIWAEIHEMRRLGQLPGLRPGAGRDLFVVVDVPDHPQRVLHLVMPPCMDEDDLTPPRISTAEVLPTPIVRVPLEELPRTTTRDVVRVDIDVDADTVVPGVHPRAATDPDPGMGIDVDADTIVPRVRKHVDDEITPVEIPIPKPPADEK